MDEHLSQLMYLDAARKTLDHHFVLWEFKDDQLNHNSLKQIDELQMRDKPADEERDDSEGEDQEDLRLKKE